MKKKMCPKAKEPALAKKDKSGNLVTSGEGLKKLYEKTYKERLKHNEIKDNLQSLQENKMKIFESRIKEASTKRTDPWTHKQLIDVLKNMKKGKARDPHGFVNDIFKPEVAGDNLIDGLLLLVNEVKRQQNVPEIFEFANINKTFLVDMHHPDNGCAHVACT